MMISLNKMGRLFSIIGTFFIFCSANLKAEEISNYVTITNIFNGGILTAVGRNFQRNSPVVGNSAFSHRKNVTPVNFELVYLDTGTVNFRHPVSGECIYAETNGETIMGNCRNDRAKWLLIPLESGAVILKNVARQGCIAANGSSSDYYALDYPACPSEGKEAHAAMSWVITPPRGNSKVVIY